MTKKKVYEGVIAELWELGKVLKIIMKVDDDELEDLKSGLNKKVKITIEE